MKLDARFWIVAAITSQAGPAAAQTAPPLRNTDLVAIGGTSNAIGFVSPQLVARNGDRTTATMVMIIDPPPRNGAVIASQTEWISCAEGTVQAKLQTYADAAGKEIARQEPGAPPAKPDPGSLGEKFMTFACTGKLPDPLAARFATMEEAIAGARAMLARNRANPGQVRP